MAHPFEKMFDQALRKSSSEHNEVLLVAEKLRAKGYREEEIVQVLKKLHNSLIQDDEFEIVGEAIEEFSEHLDY